MDPIFLTAALIYALVFWTVASRYPAVALALIFGLAPFQNDLSGGVAGLKFSVSEVHLVLSLPLLLVALLRGDKRLRSWPFLWTCGAYFAVCIASGFVTWRGGAALTSLFQMVLFFFVLIPVFSMLAPRVRDLMPALWMLLGVAAFLALAVLVTRSQYVFNIHKNGIGGSLGCAFLVAFELWFHYRTRNTWHKWAITGLMAVIAAGLLFSVSRGAWIGAMAGVIFITSMRRQFALLGRLSIVLIPVLIVGWLALPPQTREYATDFNAKRGNIDARLNNQDLAISFFEQNPLMGAGIGLRKQTDATQIVLFTLAENGILGLITLTLVFVSFFTMVWRTRNRLAQDDFSYSLIAIGGALMLARISHGMVDHYWARGPTMMGWAAAGMATGVYLYGPAGSYAGRLRRARALLSLHLLEMLRRQKRGESVPALSLTEMQHANQALTLVATERRHTTATSNGRTSNGRTSNGRNANGHTSNGRNSARDSDPLAQLARHVAEQ